MFAQIDKAFVKANPSRVYARLISYFFYEGRPLLTKGRFINPLVFKLLKHHQSYPVQNTIRKPIFIVGVGRSGTTVLGQIMASHSMVGFLNEPKAMWHHIHGGEDVIGSYSKTPGRLYLAKDDATEVVKRRAHTAFEGYLRWSRSERIVDKYPELIFRIPFVLEIFPDARFIFLARSGVNCCSSIEKWSRSHRDSSAEADWWGKNGRKWLAIGVEAIKRTPELPEGLWDSISKMSNNIDRAVVEWIVSMSCGLQMLRQYQSSMLMVKYENLVSNPQLELSRILEFCELPREEAFEKHAVQRLRVPETLNNDFVPDDALRKSFSVMMESLGYF